MKINIEKEYKVLVSEVEFNALLKYYPNAVFKSQINTYYDTTDNAIRNAHGAMRIRQLENQIYVFTLKMHTDDGLLEFEKIVDKNDTLIFNDEEILNLLQSYQIHGPFNELTTLTTKRAMIVTEFAELCFDINDYNNKRDFEIEYEYKIDHDGLAMFNSILSKISRTYEKNCSSKIQRAISSI